VLLQAPSINRKPLGRVQVGVLVSIPPGSVRMGRALLWAVLAAKIRQKNSACIVEGTIKGGATRTAKERHGISVMCGGVGMCVESRVKRVAVDVGSRGPPLDIYLAG